MPLPHVHRADHISGQSRFAKDGLNDISRRNVHLRAGINVKASLFIGCPATCLWRRGRFCVVTRFYVACPWNERFARATLRKKNRTNWPSRQDLSSLDGGV